MRRRRRQIQAALAEAASGAGRWLALPFQVVWLAFQKRRADLIGLVVLGAVTLLLLDVPLFNVLGYEFAFVIALVGSFVCCHLAVVHVHRMRRARDPLWRPVTPLGSVFALYGGALWRNLLLLALPLSIMGGHAAVVRNCDFLGGVAWYLVLPGISAAVATAWGVGLGLLFRRRRWAVFWGYAVIVGSILLGVVRFYVEPPVVQYDPFAGFFAGNFYDTELEITGAVIAARIYHLAGAAAVLAVAVRFYRESDMRLAWRHLDKRWRATGAAVLAIGLTGGLYFLGGPLSYTTSRADIERELGGVYRTPHFIIHYPRVHVSEAAIRRHGADVEFHWQELRRFFGRAPADRIRIFYFRDNKQKRRLFGAAQVDMAKPWRLEVALTYRPFPHPVVRHELAHAFASSFGDSVFGISFRWRWEAGILPLPEFNLGLIEGAAVAAAWGDAGGLTAHQWAKAMRALRVAPPMTQVMGYGFWLTSAGRSYTLAGSFCRWLIQRYGRSRFRRVYLSGGDFAEAYGKPLARLEVEWARFLRSVPLTKAQITVARERFRRRPHFKRPCVHEVARLVQQADRHLARGQRAQAADLYRTICNYDPAEPRHLLSLIEIESDADRRGPAIEAARSLWIHPRHTPPLRALALRHLGDMEWRGGRRQNARRIFEHALAYPVPEWFQRGLAARVAALRSPEIEDPLRRYFAPRRGEGASAGLWARLLRDSPDRALVHYLHGLWLMQRGRYLEGAARLGRALALGFDEGGLPAALFRRQALRSQARAYFFGRQIAKARAVFRSLDVPSQPPAVRAWAAQWARRCDFWTRWGRRLRVVAAR